MPRHDPQRCESLCVFVNEVDVDGADECVRVCGRLTTGRADAGSAEAFRKVDLEYTTHFGEAVKAANVPFFGLLSSKVRGVTLMNNNELTSSFLAELGYLTSTAMTSGSEQEQLAPVHADQGRSGGDDQADGLSAHVDLPPRALGPRPPHAHSREARVVRDLECTSSRHYQI